MRDFKCFLLSYARGFAKSSRYQTFTRFHRPLQTLEQKYRCWKWYYEGVTETLTVAESQ